MRLQPRQPCCLVDLRETPPHRVLTEHFIHAQEPLVYRIADHEEPTRQGSRHRQNAPYQRMQTKDGYLMVGAAGEAIWARCAKTLGRPEWCNDPRFATNQQRMANRDALEAVMNAVLTTKTINDWVEVFEAAGVPCGPVYDYTQMLRPIPNWARSPTSAAPVKIGDSIRVRTVVPRLGEHNAEIFGRLGVTEADIAALKANEIL